MADQQLERITGQLDTLTRMAALLLVQKYDRLSDQVDLLYRAGLSPKAIASLLDTTPNTVSVQISRKRALARSTRASPKDSRPESSL